MKYRITETVGDTTRTVEGEHPSDLIRIYNETFGKCDDVEAPVDEMLFDLSNLMRPSSIIDPRYTYGEVK